MRLVVCLIGVVAKNGDAWGLLASLDMVLSTDGCRGGWIACL